MLPREVWTGVIYDSQYDAMLRTLNLDNRPKFKAVLRVVLGRNDGLGKGHQTQSTSLEACGPPAFGCDANDLVAKQYCSVLPAIQAPARSVRRISAWDKIQ